MAGAVSLMGKMGKLEIEKQRICLCNGSRTRVSCFKTLCLSNCLFVLDLKRNSVSVSCLLEHGLTMQFNSSISIKSNNTFIFFGLLIMKGFEGGNSYQNNINNNKNYPKTHLRTP